MFEILCENLNQLMNEASINASELARRIGLPASTIKKIRNRDNPNPTLSTLLPIAHFFSISLSQLIGDIPMIKTTSTNNTIPLITWNEVVNWPDSFNTLHTRIKTENKLSAHGFALTVEEENWENLCKGTIMFFEPAQVAEHRDYVIVHKKGQKIPSLKQILHDEDQIYLKPLIQGYKISMFTPEHKILGVMIEYRKFLKSQ